MLEQIKSILAKDVENYGTPIRVNSFANNHDGFYVQEAFRGGDELFVVIAGTPYYLSYADNVQMKLNFNHARESVEFCEAWVKANPAEQMLQYLIVGDLQNISVAPTIEYSPAEKPDMKYYNWQLCICRDPDNLDWVFVNIPGVGEFYSWMGVDEQWLCNSHMSKETEKLIQDQFDVEYVSSSLNKEIVVYLAKQYLESKK